MKFKRFFPIFFSCLLIFFYSDGFAGPWLYSSAYPPYGSMSVKSDVDLLADYGFIEAPVLTWPIAWVNIGPSLLSDHSKELLKAAPKYVQQIYFRVLGQYHIEMRKELQLSSYVSGGSKINPFRTFEWQPRSDFEGGLSLERQNEYFAGNLALNYGKYYDVTHDVHLDTSYFYGFLGNWAIGVDKVNRWWGPGYTDSMILSANAPPLPTLTLQRMRAEAFQTKWLSWIGPWSFTTSLSVGGPNVPQPHPLIWLMNLSLRPLESVQFSFSRAAFFAGDNRPLNSTMLWNLAIINDNCDSVRDGADYCQKYSPGTEHWEATLDWSLMQTFSLPANLYLQTIFNDRVPYSSAPWLYTLFRPPVPGRTAFLAGGSAWTSVQNALVRFYAEFEYTHQYVYYFWGQFAPDIYGYSGYPYVYYDKLLASPLGGEAMGYSFGAVISEENGSSDTVMIRYLKLNEYNSNGVGYPFPKQRILWLSVGKTLALPCDFGQLSGQLGYLKPLDGEGYSPAASAFLVWSRRF